MNWNNQEFVGKYLKLLFFSILIIVLGIVAFQHKEDLINHLGLQTIYADITNKIENLGKSSNTTPQSFFQTERVVKIAILSQKKSADTNLNRQNLQKAVLALFNNLKDDQQYDSLVVILDPKVPANDPDYFWEQANNSFPNLKYFVVYAESGKSETDLLSQIKTHTSNNPLIILHTYLTDYSSDPLLKEIQQDHQKNVFDNINKNLLLTLGFSNIEGLKAVYQYAKEEGYLRALPTLTSPDEQYQIKYLSTGEINPTRIVTLTFFGDVMLGRHVRSLMDASTLDYPFLQMDQSYLQKNDLLIANLEGPITDKPVATSKSIAFRFKPDVAPLLAKYYFDLLSVANNHALDMGERARQDTLKFLTDQELTPFGNTRFNGENMVVKKTINGLNFAFIGLNNTDFKIDQEALLKIIKDLKIEGYLVIPFVHWGVEYQHVPSKEQIELAHAWVDAGAAAVIGMHPHVVQSFEIYQDKPIFYSLGNAIFDQYFSPDVQEGLSVTLRFSPENLRIYFVPIRIEKSQFQLLKPEQKADFLKKFTTYWRYDQTIKEQVEKGEIIISN